MRIAYIILAHKLPEQLIRLVRKLNADSVSFFIHVDKKTDAKTYKKMIKSLSEYKNVHFLKRHACWWGSFGVVRATLDGIREILAQDIRYNYAVLLTGQDYPIKSNRHILKVLRENSGHSFIEHFPLPNERWKDGNGGLNRITQWHFNWFGQIIAFPGRVRFFISHLGSSWPTFDRTSQIRRRFPENFKIFGGSAYWCLTRECIEYVNEFVQQNNRFVNFFKYTLVPDEVFFQTILLNSHCKSRLVADNLRYIIWNDTPHPEILKKKDFRHLMNTDKLFARKFDMIVDADVLDMIDKAIS